MEAALPAAFLRALPVAFNLSWICCMMPALRFLLWRRR